MFNFKFYFYLYFLCLSPIIPIRCEEDYIRFNTEKVIFHSPIPALAEASPKSLLAEPSFNQASVEFAFENGGPLTREVLANLKNILSEDEYNDLRIDTKIQIIAPNAYSNNPGWHCDHLGGYDIQKKHLVRYHPELETATRIFLVISGDPATEFLECRDILANFKVPSWKHVSDYLNTVITAQEVYRIPIATPIEMKGNEIHRVTPYQGNEPTARYLLRASSFPKGHSEYGKFLNQFFEWETHQDPARLNILGDVENFLNRAMAHLEEIEFNVEDFKMTHLCYRTATEDEYIRKKEQLSKIGILISEELAEGRPYAVFKLHEPIVYHGFNVPLIALPSPKKNNSYQGGLQHVAFVLKDELQVLLDRYPHLDFDTQELNRMTHRELKLRFDDLVVKFHNETLEDLANKKN